MRMRIGGEARRIAAARVRKQAWHCPGQHHEFPACVKTIGRRNAAASKYVRATCILAVIPVLGAVGPCTTAGPEFLVPRRMHRGIEHAVSCTSNGIGRVDRRSRNIREATAGESPVRTLRIAAIPGDGIGTEVIAAGLEVLERLRQARRRLRARLRSFRLGLGALQEDRRLHARRRARPDQGPRRHPFRRGRRARRARSHHAVGPAARHLPALRPVRQRAPDAHPAGHHQPAAGGDRARSSTG